MTDTIEPPLRFAGARTGYVAVEPELVDGNLVIEIVSFGAGKPVHRRFRVVETGSDFGRSFRLTKLGTLKAGEEAGYSVNIDDEGTLCSCWNAGVCGECKHILSLKAMIHAGFFTKE